MTSGLFVCRGAENYGHSIEVYHTILKKKKKKKKKKQKLTDFSLLPPPSLFFLSFFFFPLFSSLSSSSSYTCHSLSHSSDNQSREKKGKKEKGKKKTKKKKTKTNKQTEKTELCIGPAHLFDPCCVLSALVFLIFPIAFHTTILVDIALYRCRIIR